MINIFDEFNDIIKYFKNQNIHLFIIYSSFIRNFKSKEDYINFIDFLINVHSSSVFILPAFTYSCRRKVFYNKFTSLPDPQNGALSRIAFENFSENMVRTSDPDYSYFVLNYHNFEKSVLAEVTCDRGSSFGLISNHNYLFTLNPALIAAFDGFSPGFTPCMQVESLIEVPDRKFISIENYGKLGSRMYYSRIEEMKINTSVNRIRLDLIFENSNYFYKKNFLTGEKIRGVSSHFFEEKLKDVLFKNPRFFH